MSNDYDDDDYKLNDTTNSYHVDFSPDEVDLDDFDNLDDNLFDELEDAIALAETRITVAIHKNGSVAEIERLEDELTLLMMDYENFNT